MYRPARRQRASMYLSARRKYGRSRTSTERIDVPLRTAEVRIRRLPGQMIHMLPKKQQIYPHDICIFLFRTGFLTSGPFFIIIKSVMITIIFMDF
jgi:hypothetical protein